MPYLRKEVKDYLDEKRPLEGYVTEPGELVYVLTKECIHYGEPGTPNERFAKHCEVIGALFCTALEYYRRAVAPYEDSKVRRHGDVYPS